LDEAVIPYRYTGNFSEGCDTIDLKDDKGAASGLPPAIPMRSVQSGF
jgi:hypothetical protein